MSVPNQTPYIIYNANGLTTDFPFEFYIINTNDIQVSLNGETITSGYSVSGVGNIAGGDVIFLTPPASGTVVMLERVVPTYRLTDYQDNGDLLADTVNKDFDRLWMAIQRSFIYLGLALRRPLLGGPFNAEGYRIEKLADPVNDQDAATKKYVETVSLARTLRVPESAVQPVPPVALRANKLLAFNASGDPIAVLPASGSASDVLIELAKPTGAGLIGFDGDTVEDALVSLEETQSKLEDKTGFNAVGRFLNLSELRARVPAEAGQIVYVASAASATATEKHYGGGYFQSFDNSTSPIADDGGIVIVPSTGTLAWRRINFTAYDMQFWGVKPDGVTDNAAAITKATQYARANRIILDAPAGTIRTSKMVPIYDNMGIRGFGKAESTVFVKTTNDKYDYMNGSTVALQVDALAGFVPKKWDVPDHTMDSFCVHGRLENCLFRRESTSVSSQYGFFLGKAASPVIRQCNFEGGRTGIKVFNAFSGVMEMVAAVISSGTGFQGVDFSDVRSGVMYMTGTSMDLRCVQVRGYQFGFSIYRLQYSTMTNCTAEDINPMKGETICYAFDFYDPYCISMNACATEFVKGGQIRIQGYTNPSYRPAIKITNYLAIDQINPVAPTPIYRVDNGSVTPMNVVIEASELARVTSNANLTPPTVSGVGAKVILIGCDGEDWSASGSGVFTRLA